MGSRWSWGEQKDKPVVVEHDRLKVWCGRCWTYVDELTHVCNNPHRPLKPAPKLDCS
jgi:hypothetical protein